MGFITKLTQKVEALISSLTQKVEALISSVEQMKENTSGSVSALMTAGIVAIVALVVIVILGSALLPGAIGSITNTTTTGWSGGAVSMWTAIPIFIVLVFLLIVLALGLYVLKSID